MSLRCFIRDGNNDAEMADRFAAFVLSKAQQWRLADKVKESMKAAEEAEKAMAIMKVAEAGRAAEEADAASAALKARAAKAAARK
jgi:hypothetical protein